MLHLRYNKLLVAQVQLCIIKETPSLCLPTHKFIWIVYQLNSAQNVVSVDFAKWLKK